MRVWSLGWEDLVEEGMTTHFSILAWRIPWTEPGGLQRAQSTGWQELDTTATTEHIPGHTRLVLPHSKGGAVVVPELGIH